MRKGGKNLLGPACCRLIWILEALSFKDHRGQFRKAFHDGLIAGATEVSLNFPMSAADKTLESISITVDEESPNLFDQLLQNNGCHQKNALWGFRMLEKFLA